MDTFSKLNWNPTTNPIVPHPMTSACKINGTTDSNRPRRIPKWDHVTLDVTWLCSCWWQPSTSNWISSRPCVISFKLIHANMPWFSPRFDNITCLISAIPSMCVQCNHSFFTLILEFFVFSVDCFFSFFKGVYFVSRGSILKKRENGG